MDVNQSPDGMPPHGAMGVGGLGGPGGGGPPPGGGPMGPMGGGSSDHPYSVTLPLNVENVFNHLNSGGYQGLITSPYFLQATTVNTGFGGGGPAGGDTGAPGGSADNRCV